MIFTYYSCLLCLWILFYWCTCCLKRFISTCTPITDCTIVEYLLSVGQFGASTKRTSAGSSTVWWMRTTVELGTVEVVGWRLCLVVVLIDLTTCGLAVLLCLSLSCVYGKLLTAGSWPILSVEQYSHNSPVVFVPRVLCLCGSCERRDCLSFFHSSALRMGTSRATAWALFL